MKTQYDSSRDVTRSAFQDPNIFRLSSSFSWSLIFASHQLLITADWNRRLFLLSDLKDQAAAKTIRNIYFWYFYENLFWIYSILPIKSRLLARIPVSCRFPPPEINIYKSASKRPRKRRQASEVITIPRVIHFFGTAAHHYSATNCFFHRARRRATRSRGMIYSEVNLV